MNKVSSENCGKCSTLDTQLQCLLILTGEVGQILSSVHYDRNQSLINYIKTVSLPENERHPATSAESFEHFEEL